MNFFRRKVSDKAKQEFLRGAVIRFEQGAKEHKDSSIFDYVDLPEQFIQESQDGHNYLDAYLLKTGRDEEWEQILKLHDYCGSWAIEKMNKDKEKHEEGKDGII